MKIIKGGILFQLKKNDVLIWFGIALISVENIGSVTRLFSWLSMKLPIAATFLAIKSFS